jgi:hypothetical protein
MDQRGLTRTSPSRHRRAWPVFAGVSTTVLGACVVATYRSSGTTGAGLLLLGGLIVVGIAAALMYAIVSPFPQEGGNQHAMGAGWDGGGFDGGSDGGGGGDFGG